MFPRTENICRGILNEGSQDIDEINSTLFIKNGQYFWVKNNSNVPLFALNKTGSNNFPTRP